MENPYILLGDFLVYYSESYYRMIWISVWTLLSSGYYNGGVKPVVDDVFICKYTFYNFSSHYRPFDFDSITYAYL